MPKNFQNETDYRYKLAENQLNTIVSLLGRSPSDYELEIIDFLLSKKQRIKNFLSKTNELNQQTDKKWILKSELVELNLQDETENQSAVLICNLISKILKSNASPLAIANSLNINGNVASGKKNALYQIIKGTGKISNVLGVPNLKTDVLFHNGTQYLHSVSIGLVNDIPQQNIESQKNIYLLGKFKNYASEKGNNVSSYHYKFLKESLEELLKTGDGITIEPIDEGGLINSFIRIIKKYSKGLSIDISTLFGELSQQNFNSLLTPQHAAVLVVPKDETKLKDTAAKWELNCLVIGQTLVKKKLDIHLIDKQLVNLPIDNLLSSDTFISITNIEEHRAQITKKFSISKVKVPKKNRDVAWHLIISPNIASKSCINKHYDNMVGISSMNNSFHSDAEVFNLKGTNNALAFCLTNKNYYMAGSDELAAKIAMAELCRRLSCSGAKPLAASVNIVVPENSIQKENLIKNIKSAANKLNVSIDYAFSQGSSYKTQEIQTYVSMLGLIEDKNHHMTMSFKDKGDIIFLIGPSSENLAGSEYLISYQKDPGSYIPDFDLELERKVGLALLGLINKNMICSAHNVSKGGLFISLVESAMVFGFGFDIITDADIRTDAFLFGESPGRVIVSVTPNKENKFIDYMMQKELPFLAIGHVTKGEMRVDDISYGFIDDAKKEYNSALKRFLNTDF